MIHVCFGLSDSDGRYSKFTGTAILSIFENTNSKITAHILHDDTLTADNREKFLIMAKSYGQVIKFHNVEERCAEEINFIKQIFKNELTRDGFFIGKLYRLLTPKIFADDVEKIIYLDSDIIVNLDIAELWQIPLDDKPLAAVTEKSLGTPIECLLLVWDGIVDFENYFNSGVLVMNPKQIHPKEMPNIKAGIKFYGENQRYEYYDQDILNYCFSTNYLKLPNRFNFFVRSCRILHENKIERRIYHYTANDLGTNLDDIFFEQWFSYFEKTPWFTKEVVGRLDKGFRKIINRKDAALKDIALQMTALVSGKTRAFFVNLPNMEIVKQTFYIKADEEIIQFVNQESFQILADSMYNSRGKKIFFILFEGYPQLRLMLIDAGFVEGEDFINAEIFLPKVNAETLDTFELVRKI